MLIVTEGEQEPSSDAAAMLSSEESPAERDSAMARLQVVPFLPKRSIRADLSGLLQLSQDAVHLATELVEAQHSRLDWFGNRIFRDRGDNKARNPIAALVYNSIYTINSLVGTTMDLGLSAIEPLLGETDGSARKEAALAILNGVVGDYLTKTSNPLAIQMRLQMVGNEDPPSSNNTRRYLIVIHGACNGPQDWWQQGHNHGIELAAHLDYVPLFLQYNTGLHISENGKLLNDLLKELIIAAVDNNSDVRISILAHSMGGLVARSACHYAAATQDTSCWLSKVDRLVTLGTPHHGAILERGGKLVDAVLGAHRYTEPLSWLGKIRSNGVSDLGYGNVRDEDWMECTTGMEDCRKPTPLPAHVSCLAIAAVLGDENSSTNRLLRETYRTDGLVTEASAFGRGHENSELNLNFDETITIYNVSHVGLLHSKEVYKNVLCFLSG